MNYTARMLNTKPLAFRKKVVAAYLRGEGSIERLSAHFQIGSTTLSTWLKLHRRGSLAPKPPSKHKRGRLPSLSPDDLAFLRDLALSQPLLSRSQLYDLLLQRIQKHITMRTMDTTLKKLGIKKRYTKRTSVSVSIQKQKLEDKTRYQKIHRTGTRERKYASDLTDKEWEKIEDIIISKEIKPGKPATVPRRDVLDAIFYILRTGCQWHMLPNDFPKYKTVYSCFSRWNKKQKFKEICDSLRKEYRKKIGRNEEPSAACVDSQSVKSTEKGGL